MSSSRIIKQTVDDSTGISEFSFRNIGQPGAVITTAQTAGSFVPMGLFQGAGIHDSAQEEAVDAGPPLIEMSEDELNNRISDAFNSGLKEGKELAERGLINVFRALRASSEAIHNQRDKIFRESEDELINLVMLVARKVIIHEITQDRSILAGVVRNALAGLSAREEITVRINPDDYLLVTSGRDELLHNELLNDRLLLKPDPSVDAGFCLVETAMGTVDASLDGQMDQIYRSLLEQRTVAVVVAP
ncbi:MAG TPA: FliH/SctL family protein [Dongiaceae bacterium]|nr:FliH/SctL family protein [Dongiaceae bacterium]